MNSYDKVKGIIEQALAPLIDVVLDVEQEEQLVDYLDRARDITEILGLGVENLIAKIIDNIKARRS